MNSLLEKLGQDPQRSLLLFVRGLGLFIIGLLFIGLGYFQHHLWQIPGIFFIVIGCVVSAWGYVGLLSNRLLKIFSRINNKNTKF